jgi:hypothetical protein
VPKGIRRRHMIILGPGSLRTGIILPNLLVGRRCQSHRELRRRKCTSKHHDAARRDGGVHGVRSFQGALSHSSRGSFSACALKQRAHRRRKCSRAMRGGRATARGRHRPIKRLGVECSRRAPFMPRRPRPARSGSAGAGDHDHLQKNAPTRSSRAPKALKHCRDEDSWEGGVGRMSFS